MEHPCVPGCPDPLNSAPAMGKRKRPSASGKPLVPPPMASRKRARQVTSAFHRLEQAKASLAAVVADAGRGAGERAEARERLEALGAEEARLGGRRAYQEASMVSTSHFSTTRWAVGELQARGFKRGKGHAPKVLEVGAINVELLGCPWLDVRAIDLRSVDPRIETADFFTVPAEGRYDAVVCSMVLNSVPDPVQRGRMLRLLRGHLRDPPGESVLFLTLPRTCLEHGLIGVGGFEQVLLPACGLKCVKKRLTPKVALFVCVGQDPESGLAERYRADVERERGLRRAKSQRRSTNEGWVVDLDEDAPA